MQNRRKSRRTTHIHLSNHIGFLQGFDLDRADSTGQVVEDLTYREDARKHGTSRTEHTAEGERLHVSGARREGWVNTRTAKVPEENDPAAAFADDLSVRTGKIYLAEPKEVERGDFPDVWIQEQGGSERVGLRSPTSTRPPSGRLETQRRGSTDLNYGRWMRSPRTFAMPSPTRTTRCEKSQPK